MICCLFLKILRGHLYTSRNKINCNYQNTNPLRNVVKGKSLAVVHSKAVILLMLMHYMLLLSLSVWVLCRALVMFCGSLCLFSCNNHIAKEKKGGCLTLIVL